MLTQSLVLVPLLTVAMQFSSELRALGAEVEALDGALARAGKQVVVIHLQERGDILVEPLVVGIHLQERGDILVEPLVVPESSRESHILTKPSSSPITEMLGSRLRAGQGRAEHRAES